jgi:endo-1,4-beta-xylanase
MKSRFLGTSIVMASIVPGMFSTSGAAQTFIPDQILKAQFTTAAIAVDGTGSEATWGTAEPVALTIGMDATGKMPYPACGAKAEARALWNGNLLFVLIKVTDSNIVPDSSKAYVYMDFWNDKWPKYEDDDGVYTITYNGAGGTASVAGVGTYRLKSYKTKQISSTGYNVELAINTGGQPRRNGSKIGMDFGVSAVANGSVAACQVAWSDGLAFSTTSFTRYPQPNDQSKYGTVVLSGYDGVSPMALDNFVLQNNVTIARNLTLGAFIDTSALSTALAAADSALTSNSQATIDAANTKLEGAMYGLRRSGPNHTKPPYPDPVDLPSLWTLPDPFQFYNGTRVKSPADWNRRREEIKNLVQYYEYGYLKPRPQTVTGTLGDKAENAYPLTVTVTDNGRSTSWAAQLNMPPAGTKTPDGKSTSGPYPVVVQLSVRPGAGNAIYLNAGYAVLSVPYTVGPDNVLHTAPYYTLYPYSEITGDDTGSLMIWGWGASRTVDALESLAANDPHLHGSLDTSKLVLTGFSRLGKAALAIGMMDTRFGVVNAGGSGSGGAAPYRYDNFGLPPCIKGDPGHVYPWGKATSDEAMADHIWHNPWNSNSMFPRFLVGTPGMPGLFPLPLKTNINATDYMAPGLPMIGSRIYNTYCPGHGWGDRLPFDHHEIIAAIAPRAVIINSSNNDYSDNAEGDAIGVEGARPVYKYLGVPQNLAYDSSMEMAGHRQTPTQVTDVVAFSNMVFYGIPLSATDVGQKMLQGSGNGKTTGQSPIYVDPYGADGPTAANIYNTYFGGLTAMMPWLSNVPRSK